ncbi:hypothetical protein CROQUDRAFT_659750 [Cronartium quercuum f. sp. fusiforme G11]|uniref:Ribosomal RNA-processing protein 1 n=1 Tax=Cronartium quercuum f. sp. fusiforme G11 TaxID=708437 RepID=A0A9P6NI72_9BASI|nr:hypothetical protein CROQUDRAFT_659750 [Cronartium quercuum f. sp. fusiforme G11]
MPDDYQSKSLKGEDPERKLKRKSHDPNGKTKSEIPNQNVKRIKSVKKGVKAVSLKGDTVPLGKFLASNDKVTRDRAVAALRTFISGSTENGIRQGLFSKIELNNDHWTSSATLATVDSRLDSLAMAKLFKGLFYCYWMSDKPLVQQQLANELADLCLVYQPQSIPTSKGMAQALTTRGGLTLWRGFWEAIRREWHGLDRHRIDKYLLLLRRYTERGLRLLQRVNWHPSAIAEWAQILEETVLNVSDVQTPMSLAYHFCDVFLEEVNRTLESRPENDSESIESITIQPIPIDLLLDPFCHALAQARPGTAILQRIIESVITPLFENIEVHLSTGKYTPPSSIIPVFSSFATGICVEGDNGRSIDLSLVKTSLLRTLFKTGAQKDCLEANRKKLYALWATRGGVTDED